MPITAPPTIPLITDPSTFAVRAQDWVVWQANELYPFIIETSTLLGLSTEATSVTSNSISVGTKTFTVEVGKGFIAGQSLSIAYTTTPTNRMFAVVTSYNSTTGELVVEVQAIEGSGTYTAWSIALAFNGVIGTDQIADDAVATPKIPNDAITYPKMQNVSTTARVLGRKTAAAGDVEECTLSELLDFIGSAAQGDILYRGASDWTRLPAGTAGQYLKTLGGAANPEWDEVQSLILGTPVASTSGSAIDYGSIPAGTKQIIINFDRVSSSSGTFFGVRIGTAGSPDATGYTGGSGAISTTANTTTGTANTTGFNTESIGVATQLSGSITLTLLDPTSNIWEASGVLTGNAAAHNTLIVSGRKALSGALDIVRIYPGAGTFDNGSVNIAYF